MTVRIAEGSAAIPCLRYRRAGEALTWLCEVLGFREHACYYHADGSIAHAELILGKGMIMLGSVPATPTEYGEHVRQPDEVGGLGTQSIYLVVPDADAVHSRVVAAGAAIVIAIKDEEYGGRGFTLRDPEGHLWTVGTYDPWAASGHK